MSAPIFAGTPEQQALASEIFRLMSAQGALFAADAPIKQTLSNLTDFLAAQRKREREAMAHEIDAALRANDQVFARQEDTETREIIYITSRLGVYPTRREDTSHTFKQRLYEPDEPLPVDDISVVVSTSRPALTTVEPVFISDYWQQQAGMVSFPLRSTSASTGDFDVQELEQDRESEVPVLDTDKDTPVEPVVSPDVALDDLLPADLVAQDLPAQAVSSEIRTTVPPVEITNQELMSDIEEVVPGPAEPLVAEADEGITADRLVSEDRVDIVDVDAIPAVPAMTPSESVVEGSDEVVQADEIDEIDEIDKIALEDTEPIAPPAIFTLPDGTAIDLQQPVSKLMATHRVILEEALINRIDQDPLQRIVHFGRDLYTDADKINLGKNDLRRIRDYILEIGEPVLDTAIIADLYHSHRQSTTESFRFSLNYRLHREKEFEFVGVAGACLWSTRGLPFIGTKRVKASEMGHLTSYLVEGYDDSLEQQHGAQINEEGIVNRQITFFEWEHGILPLDASLATLLPQPLLSEQRSVVLRFDVPQHYTSYLVEVRYPTGNRGGWLQGLEDFFHEHLVAGAIIKLARTEEPHVFTLTYEESGVRSDRLLTFDDKKNKFVFANLSYECAVDSEQLLSQRKFGKLKNLKALPTPDRRKADFVLAHVFEVVGEQLGTRNDPLYWLSLDDLYVAYNVLRPASRPYIESLLAADAMYAPDEATPGAYYYKPVPEVKEIEEEEDTDVLVYDDDDEY